MRSLSLLIFLLISICIHCANSDEIKCTCYPCGYPCPNPSPPPPSPPPPSPPPPSEWPPPSPPSCPPPPSEWPTPSKPSPYPPVSPSPPSPSIPYRWGPPGVLYPVDPGYFPSGAHRRSVERSVVLVMVGISLVVLTL